MLEIHIPMQLLDKHGAWAHDYYREDGATPCMVGGGTLTNMKI